MYHIVTCFYFFQSLDDKGESPKRQYSAQQMGVSWSCFSGPIGLLTQIVHWMALNQDWENRSRMSKVYRGVRVHDRLRLHNLDGYGGAWDLREATVAHFRLKRGYCQQSRTKNDQTKKWGWKKLRMDAMSYNGNVEFYFIWLTRENVDIHPLGLVPSILIFRPMLMVNFEPPTISLYDRKACSVS